MPIFDGHNWYLLVVLTMLSLTRVSESILIRITLYHTGAVLNQFVFEKIVYKYVPCLFLMNITGT